MLQTIYRQEKNGTETCFQIESSRQLKPTELDCIEWLIMDLNHPDQTDYDSFLLQAFVEIGPRLSVETPASSNAVSICQSIGIDCVRRIEQFVRYPLSDNATKEIILAQRLDPMTQEVYRESITTFDSGIAPKAVRHIQVLERGEDALREINAELGLGMDAFDITFYRDLFRNLGRNPTDVELFQIGNANSEHCRHWYFKGLLVIDGKPMPMTLLDMVREPLRVLERAGHTNTILAFNDDAGAIRGHHTLVFLPSMPGYASPFVRRNTMLHITATAETHNHPTMWAPYPGAETGVGGRIRDNSAAGRGARPLAGFAGYCVGNLHIPGYGIPGEVLGKTDTPYAQPLHILIEASDGAADYGNQFGEPCIGGFTRSCGLIVDGQPREFRKPILYSGGVGRIEDMHAKKQPAEPGMLIIQIGGPAYRIGVGGGSASSMMQGQSTAALDFNSVQRGNGEMKQRTNRVLIACMDMGEENPIISLHDQGAGGPSNVLVELLEPLGGKMDIRSINLGDVTMSVLEIWSAEYQERYGLLIDPHRYGDFQHICDMERVNCEVMGEITGDGHVMVSDSLNGTTPVHLNLESILTKIPQKTFTSDHLPRTLDPLVLPDGLDVADAIQSVFALPQVGSKRYLTSKKDRSVTGLVAQQQCCGPTQIPVADVAVTTHSFFGSGGAATAIGEQPNKLLVDPAAGARMCVGEMLTNMAAARVTDINDISCRANWMWPAKLPGEGALMYDAVKAMSELMIQLGISVDGGKDSLSMAAQVNGETVKAPGQLVILGYAPMDDVTKVLTPDFKHPGESLIGLIDLGRGRNRLGGSSLAQAYGQVGDTTPDVDDPDFLRRAFLFVQALIDGDLITALHDRSDGGLVTSVIEMCLAGNCGARISIEATTNREVLAALFSEELGIIFECDEDSLEFIEKQSIAFGAPFGIIGKTQSHDLGFAVDQFACAQCQAVVFQQSLTQLRQWWEETATRIEMLQANPAVVEQERASHGIIAWPQYGLTFKPHPTADELLLAANKPRVAIIREEGTNGDKEMAAAFSAAGFEAWDVSMNHLLHDHVDLDNFHGVVFCGGFSFMDTFGSAKGWAASMLFNDKLRAMFKRFYERSDTFSLGVCNGCQLMGLLGWVPKRGLHEIDQPHFVHNASGRFESRWTNVVIQDSPSILLRTMAGSRLGIWVAHGEGRLLIPGATAADLIARNNLAPMSYISPEGEPTETYPYNPNGSPHGWTALCSEDGRHLAMMPHPERCFLKRQWSYMPEDWKEHLEASPWLQMFQNARNWVENG